MTSYFTGLWETKGSCLNAYVAAESKIIFALNKFTLYLNHTAAKDEAAAEKAAYAFSVECLNS